MAKDQDLVKDSEYNKDLNPFTNAESHTGVFEDESENSSLVHREKIDSTHSENIHDPENIENIHRNNELANGINSINVTQGDKDERDSSDELRPLNEPEPHSEVLNLNQTVEIHGVLSETIDFPTVMENDQEHIEKRSTVSSEDVYVGSKKKTKKKKKPSYKIEAEQLKYTKQNTCLSTENHPVVALLQWCIRKLVAEVKFTGSQNFLVTSGHFKTFAKISLRRQPFFQSDNHVPTIFKIHLPTPDIYYLLRKKFQVTENCLQDSLGREHRIDFDEKRKTFLSPDGLFRVNIVNDEEIMRLQRILPEYYKHIVEKEGETCLPKYVSLLIIFFGKKKYNLLVAKNNILPTEMTSRVFPVKGSVLRRDPLQDRADLETGSIKLSFDDDERKKIHKIIAQDIKFLESCEAIHYQLFIAEYNTEDLESAHLDMLDTHPGSFIVPTGIDRSEESLGPDMSTEIEELSENDEEGNTNNVSTSEHPTSRNEENFEDNQNPINHVRSNSDNSVDMLTSRLLGREPSFEQIPDDTVKDGASQEISKEQDKQTNGSIDPTRDSKEEISESRINTAEADDAKETQTVDVNMTELHESCTPVSGLEFHKKNFKCNHELQYVLGDSSKGSPVHLYCFEFRNILKTYTCRRRVARAWNKVRFGDYAGFASTVTPGEYATRLRVVAYRLFKQVN